MDEDKIPLTAHLEELRNRLIACLIAVGIGFAFSYYFSEKIFFILASPLQELLPENNSFIFTNVTEAFFTYLKLAIFSGIFLAFPVILYQTWCFIAPGLYQHERRYAVPFVILSTFFFLGGTSFGYFLVLPIAFKFFMGYNTQYLKLLPSISQYLSFSCKFLLAFGIVFEMPVFILFLSRMGIVTSQQLKSNRRIVIVCVFIVAAFLTPPDVVSQVLMAGPLIILFEISIITAQIFGKKVED